EELRDVISKYLKAVETKDKKETESIEDASYKIERDGKLLGSVAIARTAQEKMGDYKPIVLLSSSRQLRNAEDAFAEAFGDPRVVITLGAFSYLLSSVPEAGLGADSLRRALFEFGRSAGLNDVARRALRIIKGTEMYDIPWAERGLLQHTLSANLRSEAEKRGISSERLRRTLEEGEDPKTSARLIAQSLKDLAIHDRVAEDLA